MLLLCPLRIGVCKLVLICSQSFNTLSSGSLMDENLFLQTLPIFYETTRLPYQVTVIKTTEP